LKYNIAEYGIEKQISQKLKLKYYNPIIYKLLNIVIYLNDNPWPTGFIPKQILGKASSAILTK